MKIPANTTAAKAVADLRANLLERRMVLMTEVREIDSYLRQIIYERPATAAIKTRVKPAANRTGVSPAVRAALTDDPQSVGEVLQRVRSTGIKSVHSNRIRGALEYERVVGRATRHRLPSGRLGYARKAPANIPSGPSDVPAYDVVVGAEVRP